MLQAFNNFADEESCLRGLSSEATRKLMSAFHGLIFRDIPNNLGTLPQEDRNEKSMIRTLRVDFRQTVPYRRIKLFLSTLEETAQTLRLKMVSRKYRNTFTRNYRALMPIDRRLYRVDVLEAGQDSHGALWVNGERYALSPEVITENLFFRECWFILLERLRDIQVQLDQCSNQKQNCQICNPHDLLDQHMFSNDEHRNDERNLCQYMEYHTAISFQNYCQYCEMDWLSNLGVVLIQFDKAWTNFERCYITELINIESRARRLVMKSIYTDEELQLYEEYYSRLVLTTTQSQFQGINKEISRKRSFAKQSTMPMKIKLKSDENNNNDNNNVEPDVIPSRAFHDVSVLPFDVSEASQKIRNVYHRLIDEIGALNAAANIKRKGRRDFNFNVLITSFMIIDELARRKEDGRKFQWIDRDDDDDWIPKLNEKELRSLLPIAQPVLTEIVALRSHLRLLSETPERIDPHLVQNHTLVSHLAEFESKWDIADQWLSSQMAAQSFAKFLLFVSEIADIDHFSVMNRSSKRQRKSHEFRDINVLNNIPDNISNNIGSNKVIEFISKQPRCRRECCPLESFEERIAALDVGAFLALPRLVVLFFVCCPHPDSHNYYLLNILLPEMIQTKSLNELNIMRCLQSSTTEPTQNSTFNFPLTKPIQSSPLLNPYAPVSLPPVLSTSSQRELLTGPQFFKHLQNLVMRIDEIPEFFRKVILAGERIAILCQMAQRTLNRTSNGNTNKSVGYNKTSKESNKVVSNNKASTDSFEGLIFQYILERLTANDKHDESCCALYTQLSTIKGLHTHIDTFCNAVEEISITLQRRHPEDWNSFIHIIIQCLPSLRNHHCYTNGSHYNCHRLSNGSSTAQSIASAVEESNNQGYEDNRISSPMEHNQNSDVAHTSSNNRQHSQEEVIITKSSRRSIDRLGSPRSERLFESSPVTRRPQSSYNE